MATAVHAPPAPTMLDAQSKLLQECRRARGALRGKARSRQAGAPRAQRRIPTPPPLRAPNRSRLSLSPLRSLAACSRPTPRATSSTRGTTPRPPTVRRPGAALSLRPGRGPPQTAACRRHTAPVPAQSGPAPAPPPRSPGSRSAPLLARSVARFPDPSSLPPSPAAQASSGSSTISSPARGARGGGAASGRSPRAGE
jgi:translation initiation factor IF-2